MRKLLATAAVLALGLTPALAQQDRSQVEIKVEPVGEHVYALFGSGGNIGVSVGEDGVFVIDDQFADLSDRIVAAIRTLSDAPVRFLVNTHWHGDHTGGNANFATAQHALIFAHDNVRARLMTGLDRGDGRVTPPAPAEALPVVTFSDKASFHLNGETVEAIHVAAAHTDGDTILHFTGSNVIHMGDTYFAGRYPFIDVASGGNVNGVIAAADLVMSLADDDTRIIPGHGPVSSKADLAAYRAMLADIRDSVAALIAQGKSLQEVQAAGTTAAYDEAMTWEFIKGENLVEAIYRSLGGK